MMDNAKFGSKYKKKKPRNWEQRTKEFYLIDNRVSLIFEQEEE